MIPRWLESAQIGTLLLTAALLSAGYGTAGLVLILTALIVEGLLTKRFPWTRSVLDVPLVAFLGIFTLAGWLSDYRPVAVASTGLAAFTVYVGYGGAYRMLTRRHAHVMMWFLWAWFAGGVATGLWAIAGHMSTGEAASVAELGPNATGTTLMVALLIGLGLFAASRGVGVFIAAAGCAALSLGLVFTYTRGAWLGAGVGIVTLFAAAKVRYTWKAGVLLVACLFLLAVSADGVVVHRLSSIFAPERNKDRLLGARASLAIVRDHPITGTGLNTFSLVFPPYKLPEDPTVFTQPFAPNIFLNMAIEGGLPGAAVFASLILGTLALGIRWRRAVADRQDVLVSATALAAFTGLMTHQQVDGTVLSVHLGAGMWFLMGILAAGERRARAVIP